MKRSFGNMLAGVFDKTVLHWGGGHMSPGLGFVGDAILYKKYRGKTNHLIGIKGNAGFEKDLL